MTRNSRRVLLLTGIFGLSLLSCGREVTGPGDGLPFGFSRVAALAIDPAFPQLPGTNLASDIVPFVTVRVTLRGLDGVVVKDTVVDFPSTADSVALALTVPLPFTASDSGVPLTLAMAFVNAAGDTVFRGGPAAVRARPAGTAAASVPIVIPVSWVPPGAVPASVVMTPTTGTVVAGTTTVFSATAFDGGGAPIPGTPIDFSADTASRASFAAPGSGTVTWLPNRGNVRIIASTLNQRADTSFFVVALPASRLLAVSGGAQSALIGTALAQPLVFRVTASDSVPVSGIPVTFAVTTGGGTLAVLSDTSDATGLVSTSWTLGSLVGAQSITATATGLTGATQVVTATGLAPLPTQLAITASPLTGVAGATLATVVVDVRDANNVRTALFTGPVTLALNAGATGATLAGTATVNAVAGIATFADLSIQRAAGGLTFTATSGALTPDTSAALAITPAAPAVLVALAGDAQTGTLGQPLVDSLDVQLRDAFANPISGATLAFSVVTGGGSIAPATAVTDVNGRARASWTLGAVVGAQSARAQLDGVPAIFAALTATGAPGAPVRLEILTETSATQVAGAPFAPAIVVRAVDAVGATVTAFTGTVGLALAANPTSATPSGTLSTAAVAGVATFSNVILTTSGVGYTFAATSGALVPDTTIAITVLNAAAAQLTLVSGNAQSGVVITALPAPFVVRVIDSFGNGVPGFAVNWAITSTGGALSATVTATDAGGFTSTTLTLPSVAGTATVQATAGGLTGSPQLFTATATAGTATQLVFTLDTGSGIAGTPITPGWVIQARDGLGNVVPSFTGAITVALTNGPPTAVLGGTTTVNAVAGVATFADLTVDLAASSWVLAATSPGLTGANSAAFSIGAAAPAQIALLGGGAQSAAVLAALADSIAFRVTDQFGNIAVGAPVTVAITVGGGSVSPVGGVTDAAGRFATAWTLGTLLGAQSITATITTAPTAQAVATATATPGAAVALALVNTIGSQVSGATIPDLVVEARDASGNVATTFNGVVNGRVLTGPNGPDIDSVSVTAVNGVATFSGQTFETAGDYTLRFNAVGLTDVIHPTITVTPGAAASIAVVAGNAQTGVVSATLTDSVTFRVTDTFGNGVPGTLIGIAVTTGGGVLAPPTGSTNATGEFRTAWTLGSPLGAQSITATVAAAPAVQAVATATAIAGAATQLVITSTPLGPQVAGVAFPDVVVEARDAAGNVATGFAGQVRALVQGTVADSAFATAVAGVATFTGAFLETAGTFDVRFTVPGLTDALSNTFVVAPAAPAILDADGANSGDGQTAPILTTLANPLRALLTDTYLNPIAGVTVLFTATRGIDTLGVDTVVTDAQGIASITPTMPETVGPIAYLVSTAGLTGFTLNVTVVVGAAANLTLGTPPGGGSVDAPIGTTDVTARDIGGNTVLTFTGNVTVTIDSGTVGALMAGTLTQAAVGGVASFTDLRIDRPGDYRLRFTSLGLSDEITATFTMTVGAPASVTAIAGDGQTGGASLQLPDSIGARVADQFGNPLAGATVVWTVQAGGGSLAVASGSTDASGIMRNAWTLGANVGTQSVSAEASGLTPALFTATATVVEANVVWTGVTSAAWSVASNWSGGVVPAATDSVRIPAGTPFSPALDTEASIVGRLLVQNGATLVLDTFPLFVAGTLDVAVGATVLSDSLGGFALIGNGTVRGAMPQLFVQSGTYALNGALSLTRDLAITGGSLAIGTFAADVGGTLSTVGTGQLVMTAAPGSLAVAGDAIFSGGSTAGLLTAGVLSVQGDFLQAGGAADAFSASGTHVVELNGTVMQTVTLLNADAAFTPTCGTGSCFATLRSFKGAGEGAIEFGSDAKAITLMQFSGDSVYAPGQTLLSAGSPDFQTAVTVATAIGWQTALTRGASFQVDTLIAWGTGAALIASENLPTIVLGEYQVTGTNTGAIIVDGANGVLDVNGLATVGSGTGLALVTRGNGRVRMAQVTDTLAVVGDADFGGATVAGEMTNGLLEIDGDFVMSNETDDAFIASGAHITRFVGLSPTAEFVRIGGNQFANLALNSANGFAFTGNATVLGDVVLGATTTGVSGGLITIGGDLIDSVGTRWQIAETFFQAADPVIPPQFTGSAVFLNGVVLDTATSIGGNLEIRGGLLDLNGRRVDVAGQFEARTTGALRMANAADTLIVTGTATFRGASSAGQLTAGHLELRGDFAQSGNAEAFAGSGTHETWFSGTTLQTVGFASPGSGAGTSHFGTLYLSQQSGTSSLALASDIYVDGLLENGAVASGSDVTGTGQRIVSRGADFSNVRFTNVRWQLADGAVVTQIDSLSFLSMDPAAIAFEIVRTGGTVTIPNLTFAGYVPTNPGRYLRVEDTDGPTANGALTVNITTPAPATHGGFLEVVNGAVVNGWTDFAGLNWTGAVSTDWSTLGNWAENRIPAATDSVLFGVSVVQMPVLTIQPTVRALVNENANPVTMTGGNGLFVQERLVLRPDTDGLVCDGGSVDLTPVSAAGVVPAQGRLRCNVTVSQGRVVLSDSLVVVDSTVSVQGTARIVPNGRRLRTLGSLVVSGNGAFEMTGATDTVIARNANFGGSATAGTMTAGELILSGALIGGAGADAFAPSGTHRTTFVSGVVDTANISFADPSTATFARLEVQRPVRVQSRAPVAADLFLYYGGAIAGPGRLEIAGAFVGTSSTNVTINALEIGGVFADTGSYQADTTVFTGTGQVLPFRVGATAIPRYRTVRVTGDATAVTTGGLDSLSADLIVEGTLRFDDVTTPANVAIARDLIVRGGGRLSSSNQPHSFLVYRHAAFAGADADGDFAVGAMFVRGNFTQLSTTSARSFRPAPAFETHLDSVGTVSFADAVESRFGRLAFTWSGGVRTMLTAVNVAGLLDLSADGGATLESDVLGSGSTRQLTANGVVQSGTMQFRNVALRLQGDLAVNFTTTMTFSDFDPLAVQLEIARDSGTVIVYDPVFSTVPTSGGRYLRALDTNVGDALPLTVEVNGVPTPQFHGGLAEAVAPAVLNGWLANPNFTWTGGGTTSNWNTPANWAGGSLPSAADSVFVPGGLLYNPIIPAGITIRAFVSARTDSPIGAAGSFTITERLHVPTQGGLDCPVGSVSFSNAVTPMTASGYMSCFLRVLDGTLTATDTLDVGENDIQVEGTAILDAGSALVAASGPFSTLTGGRLRMQDDSAHVRLSSGASFGGGSTAGLLTAGLLEVGGNFTQNGDAESFSASGTHVTAFTGSVTQGVDFANPGANAGFSHFVNLEIGQPAGSTSVDLATDAFAVGQLRVGTDPQRLFTSSTGQTLTTHGADITGVAFDNVRWQLRDGAPVATIAGVSFSNMDPSVAQFDAERSTGTASVNSMTFNTAPTTGAYVRVADVDGATGGNFTLSMSGTSPGFHGGAVQVIAPAVLDGWAENPGFTWTGATDANWLTASNWSDGVVPTGADSVNIPTGLATYPVIGADTAVRVLTMDAGATLDHSGANFAVRGSVDLAPTAAVTASSGRTELTGLGAQTVRGSFGRIYLDGGNYSLSGSLTTSGNVEIYNGDLSVGNFDFTVGGGFLTGLGGTMTMTGTGTVDVASYVNFFGNSTAGRLTNGILRVRGDFEQLSGGGQEDLSFSASGAHVVELAGTGRQRVRFDSPDTTINTSCATSCFATLRSVQAPGTGWVEFSNGVKVLGDLDLQADSVVATVLGTGARLVVAGTARFDAPVLRAGLIAWQDSVAQNTTVALDVDSLVAWGTDTLLVGMPGVRTIVAGSYRLRGTMESSVDVQGALAVEGATRVIGNFRTSAGGTIAMSLLGDTLQVDSTATFGGGSTAGLLTGGTVRVGGNFFATSSAAYAANGAHRTVLYSGCGLCDGYFVGLSDTLSTFRELAIESGSWTVNPPSAPVRITDNLSLLGGAQLDGSPLVRVGNNVTGALGTALSNARLSVAGAFDFAGTYFVDTLILAGANHTLTALDPLGNARNYNSVRVTGTATVIDDAVNDARVLARLIVDGGALRVGTIVTTDSARLTVNGFLETINGGVLEMQTPLGRIVTGNANFAGGSTAGLITAGTLAINGGDFFQAGDPEAFVASGTHETRFSNEGVQQVTFADPGTGAGASRFQHLRIQQAEGSGLELLTDVVAAGQLRESMSAPALIRAPLTAPRVLTTGGARVVGVEFDYVRWVLGDGAPVDSTVAIRFNSMPDTVTQFDIIRGGGTVALETLDFLTPPSTGLYLRAEDGDVGNGIPLVVAVTFPTPTTHGGAIAEVGGATITGWPQDPPLLLTWLGLLSSDFTNPANWVEGTAPDPTAEVTIVSGGNFGAAISSNQTVRRLTVAAGATLFLNPGDTLTVTGDVDVSGTIIAGALNDSTVVLRMVPTDTVGLRATGEIGGRLVIDGSASGVVQLTDSVRVTGNFRTGVNVRSGALDLNGRRMDVLGEFRTLQTGVLRMDAPADTLVVGENIIFGGGSTNGLLTNGVIVANSGLTQRNTTSAAAFTATGSHTVRFVGGTYDSQVEFQSPGAALSRFANVALDKIAGRSVNFFNTSTFIRDLVSIAGPVFVNNAALNVSGSVVQPGVNGVFDVDVSASVTLSGVTGATCDGLLFIVNNTPGNFTPIACWQPPLQGIVWTGAVSSLWSGIGNWDLGRVPIATDSVYINGSVLSGAGNPYSVDINVSSTVAKLLVGPSATLTLNHTLGQTLQIDDLASIPSNVTFNLTGGSTLTGAGAVDFGGFLNWNGGTLAGAGTMNVQAGGTADIASTASVTLNGRTLTIGGTATIGEFSFNEANSPTLATAVGGQLTFTAPKSLFLGSTPSIVNAGTLRISPAGTTVRIDWPISNTGTIEVASGTLDLRNTLTHSSGTISILANATLVNGGNTVASAAVAIADFGTLTLQSGGISADAGNHIFGSTSSISGLGAMRINSADTVRIQGTMNLDSLTVQNGTTWFESAVDTMFVTNGAYLGGGFVRGTGVLGIRGNFSTLPGNLVGSGTIAVLPGATYTPQADVLGWQIDVGGTMIWGDYFFSLGQDPVSSQFAAINVRSGGLVDIQHGATDRDIFGASATVTTAAGGTIRKSAGTGISTFRQAVNHSGIFDVLAGTLNMQTVSCTVTGGTKTGPGALVGGCVIP